MWIYLDEFLAHVQVIYVSGTRVRLCQGSRMYPSTPPSILFQCETCVEPRFPGLTYKADDNHDQALGRTAATDLIEAVKIIIATALMP